MTEIIRNTFLLTGALVWFALLAAGVVYTTAFVATVYYWRWGKGARWVKTGRLPQHDDDFYNRSSPQ